MEATDSTPTMAQPVSEPQDQGQASDQANAVHPHPPSIYSILSTGALRLYLRPIFWTNQQPNLLACCFVRSAGNPEEHGSTSDKPITHEETLAAAGRLLSAGPKDLKDALARLVIDGCGMRQVL